jgi:hypothetical protein
VSESDQWLGNDELSTEKQNTQKFHPLHWEKERNENSDNGNDSELEECLDV